MKRIHETNINTPQYWEKYQGPSYESNVRKSGIARYEEMVKHISDDTNILDVGCNFGDFLKYMIEEKTKFKSYTGFDFSPVAINRAKVLFPNYRWLLGDCSTFMVEYNKYDTVVCMQMLEHIEDPVNFLKLAHKRIKSNGTLLLTIPNQLNIQHESHVWLFDKESIKKILTDIGFINIEIDVIDNNKILFIKAKKQRMITVVTPVLCPSENVFKSIKKCFETIRKSVNKVHGEWIIVDDNSAVGSEYFRNIADVYIRNNETTGVSTSLNRGFKIAKGEFLVKLDSDYLVPENLFEVLLKDWSDNLAFIAPSFTIGNPNRSEHFNLNTLPIPEGGIIEKPSGMSNVSVHSWGGGILMFDREKLKEIDYFDEDFDIGSAQDNDVIHRILMKGHNWRWSNNVLTRHFASISSNDPNAPDSRGERRRIGKEIFKNKHGFEPGGYISYVKLHFKY